MLQPNQPAEYALVRLADRLVYWHSQAFDRAILHSAVDEWLEGLREPTRGGVTGPVVWSSEAAPRDEEKEGRYQITAHPFLLEGIEVALLVASHAIAAGALPTVSRDEVTGLADRGALELRLAELMRSTSSQEVALLFADLDGFKEVNDRFGHLVGDEVLAEIGRRLEGLVRGGDFIARFGGDEFVILVEGAQAPEQLDGLVARLRRAIEQPVDTSAGIAQVGVSIGIAVSTEGFRSPREWLAAADRRMYDEKRRGQPGEAIGEPPSEW